MTKKFIGIFLALTLILSLFSVNVSAAYVLRQDFSSNDTSMFTGLISPDGNEWVREVSDGVLHIYNPADGAMSQSLLLDDSFDGEAVLQFDMRMDSTTGYLITNLYRGGSKGRFAITLESAGVYSSSMAPNSAHTPQVWYTYIYHMNDEVMDIYRKERDADEPFRRIVAGVARTSNESAAQLQPYCAKGMDAYMDNIILYSGTFAEAASFEIDGQPVSDIDDITSGTLTAKAKVVTSIVTAEETPDGTFASDGAAIKPLMVVYNKHHKMIYSEIAEDANLCVGENDFEFSIDTSSFADKLDGGYIGFYIWDDFGNLEPLMDAIELR